MKERCTKFGVTAIVCVVVLISIGAWVSLKAKAPHVSLKKTEKIEMKNVSDFPAVTATTTDQIRSELLDAFQRGQLHEISTFDVTGSKGDTLVLAAPEMNGAQNEIQCGLNDNPLCGLYLQSASGTSRVLIWGARLTGFNGVEGFPDSRHAIISLMWNLYHFTSIDREQLDLENGTLIPVLSIEQDVSDTDAEIRASGYGDIVTLRIHGNRVDGMILPSVITILNQSGQTVFTLDQKTTSRFDSIIQSVQKDHQQLLTILVHPTDSDIKTRTLQLLLYGEPWVFDLQAKTLKQTMSTVNQKLE
ncbi:MAG: hypothetical protein WC477_01140 [Patescibacteria group bacterium]